MGWRLHGGDLLATALAAVDFNQPGRVDPGAYKQVRDALHAGRRLEAENSPVPTAVLLSGAYARTLVIMLKPSLHTAR